MQGTVRVKIASARTARENHKIIYKVSCYAFRHTQLRCISAANADLNLARNHKALACAPIEFKPRARKTATN